MNHKSRIDSISNTLENEYMVTFFSGTEQYELLLDRIETAISKYKYIRIHRNSKSIKPQKTTINDFAIKHGLGIQIGERNNEIMGILGLKKFWARFVCSEISVNGISNVCGNGDTEEDAINNYARYISGKMIVVDRFNTNRREIRVPILSKATKPEFRYTIESQNEDELIQYRNRIGEKDQIIRMQYPIISYWKKQCKNQQAIIDKKSDHIDYLLGADCMFSLIIDKLRTDIRKCDNHINASNKTIEHQKDVIRELKNQRRDLTAVVAKSELVTESKSRQERIVKNWQVHEHILLNVIEYHADRYNKYVQTNQSLREENDTLKAKIVNLRAQLDAHKRFVSVCKTTSENRKYVVESLRRAICEFETMENY